MSLPTITGIGRLVAEPELRYAPSGTAVCKLRLAFNSRKKNDQGEWVDADVFYVTGTLFKDEAERVAESLTKGTEVLVTGRLKTRKYKDKDGNERSITDLMVDSLGASMRYANVKVSKLQRKSASTTEASDDAWAGMGGFDNDEAPF